MSENIVWERIAARVKVTDEDTHLKIWQSGDSALVDKVIIPKYQFTNLAIHWLTEHLDYDVQKREPEILPCPYCDNSIKIEDFDWETSEDYATIYAIECGGCGVRGATCNSLDEAIEAWNALPRKE